MKKKVILIIILIILICSVSGLVFIKFNYSKLDKEVKTSTDWVHDDIYNSDEYKFRDDYDYEGIIFKNGIFRLFPDNNRYTIEFEVDNTTKNDIYHQFVKLTLLDETDSVLCETDLPIESIKAGETKINVSTYDEIVDNLSHVKKFRISKSDIEEELILDDNNLEE